MNNAMRFLVVAILLHLTAVSTHRQKSVCYFGSGCPFPCQCATGVACDPLTGCQGNCLVNKPDYSPSQPGWEGDGCQTGNVAYNKTAWQYSVFDSRVASRAVDGVVDREGSGVAQPKGPPGGGAWWTVDLGTLHTVYSTRLMNTNLDGGYFYLNKIRVYVSNSSIPDNNATISEDDITHYGFIICGEHPGQVPKGDDADVPCSEPLIGRYVLVYKYASDGGPDLQETFLVAEVTVRGQRYVDCTNCTSECNSVYGCMANCPPGKNQTTFCSADCKDGSFGVNCGGSCSGHCAENAVCEKINGTCPGGCKLWWTDSRCATEIGPPVSDIVHTLTAPDVTFGDVTLTWDPLENITPGLESHYGYVISQQNHQDQRLETIAGDPWTDITYIYYTGTVNTESYTVMGLNHNSWFSFRLQVYRQDQGVVERAPDNGTVDVKTMCVQPAEPMVTSQVFSPGEGGLEAAIIAWDLVVPSNSGCDYVNSYVVSYRLAVSTSDLNERFFDNTTNVFLLLSDESGTYIIRITARNNGDFESYTQIEVILELHGEQCTEDHLSVTAIGGWVCFGVSLVVIVLLTIRLCCGTRSTTSHKKDTSHVTYINSPPPSGTASFHAALDGVYAEPDDIHTAAYVNSATPSGVASFHAAPDRAHAASDGVNTAPVDVRTAQGINIVGEHVGTSQMAALPADNPYEAITEFDMAHSEYAGLTHTGRAYQNV